MKNKIKYIALGSVAVMLLSAASCEPAADVASRNLSTAADNFEVPRRVSVVNGITGDVSMVVEGFCSLDNNNTDTKIAFTCRTESGNFIKNFLLKSDNTFVMVEQLADVNVSTFHYRTVFRPQSLIPDIDFQGNTQELLENQNTNG